MPDAPKPAPLKDSKDKDPQLSAIETCLNAIRSRLFMVRAVERLIVGLLFGGIFAAAYVLARYVIERFPPVVPVILSLPALMLLTYWIIRWSSQRKPKDQSALCMKSFSILALVVIAAAGVIFGTDLWFKLPLWAFAAAPLAIFGLFAFFAGRPVSPQAAAIFVDRRAGLQEKVSTAFELLQRGAITPAEARFQAPLVADAATACRQVRASKVGYSRLDRRLYLAAFLMSIGVFAFTLITPLPALAAKSRPKVIDPTVVKARSELEKTLAELEKMKTPNEKGLDPLAGLKATINNTPSDSEKLDAMANADKQIDKYSAELNKYKSNTKSTESLANDKNLGELGKALAQFDKAMTEAGKGGSPDAQAQARADAEKAIATAAGNLAGKLAEGKLTPSDKQMIQDALNAARENAKGDPQLQAAIDRAKEALAKGDAKALEKAIKDMGTQMASNIGDKHANQDSYAKAQGALQKFSSQLKGDQNNQASSDPHQIGSKGSQQNGAQQNGSQQASAQQNGTQQNGSQQNGSQQANGSQQNGSQQNGAQQNGSQQAAGSQQNGAQQNGGQQNGGQQAGGQEAGGQQNGGQQAGGQQAGGQQNGGQQAGGQQAGGQQAGGQQNSGQQAGGQQGGKEQGGSQAGGADQNSGNMERKESATGGGEQTIDGQQQAAAQQAAAQQAAAQQQSGNDGSGQQSSAQQAGGQQGGQQAGNDGGGAPNGQQQAGGQQAGAQQGGQQGGMQGGQQGGNQTGTGGNQQGTGSNNSQSTNQLGSGGPSNDSGSQGVVGIMQNKGTQVVTEFGGQAKLSGKVDLSVKPDSSNPFMAPADKQKETFMGYDPSAQQSRKQVIRDQLGNGQVAPSRREIVRDFFLDEQPQPKP